LSRIVDRINKIRPDLIIFGGDYVHYSSKYIEPVFIDLGKLQSKYGGYGILGNHNHYADAALTMMAKYGDNSIDNQLFWVRNVNDCIKSVVLEI